MPEAQVSAWRTADISYRVLSTKGKTKTNTFSLRKCEVSNYNNRTACSEIVKEGKTPLKISISVEEDVQRGHGLNQQGSDWDCIP